MLRQHYAALNETLWAETLPNGLKVCVVQRADYGTQFAFFAAQYGGMHVKVRTGDGEWGSAPSGTAHYLEHKLFETENGSVSTVFAESGASDNAFTAADMTGYYFDCTCDFEKNLKLLLNFVSKPCFTDESVERERGIITQEIRMEKDDPYSELYYKVMEMLYSRHPIKERIAGTEESILGITAETLHRCHKAYYSPGNMVLCVAGNVDPETVVRIAVETLPRGSSAQIDFDYIRQEPPAALQHFIQWEMPVSVPLFSLGIKGDPSKPGNCLRQRFTAELACDVLFGPSSALYNRLYDENLINGSFGGDYEYVSGAAYILISGESRDPTRVRDEILREATRISKDGIDSDFWDQLVRAAYGVMVRSMNSLEDICIELAQAHFDGEDYLRFPEIFQSIDKKDVERMLERWCIEERSALAVAIPQK